jgi:hypothetical protein
LPQQRRERDSQRAQRVGVGQQALEVAAQLDLVVALQVNHPGLQVVRMGCQDGVAEQPATHIRVLGQSVARARPGFNSLGRHALGATRQASRTSDRDGGHRATAH